MTPNDSHPEVRHQMQLALPVIESFPSLPEESPPKWSELADNADRFLMNPSNGVLRTDDHGYPYFTAFLEGKSKELITYGCVILGKILRGDDVSLVLPTLEAFYSEEFGLFLNSPGSGRIEHWYLMDVNALAFGTIKLQLSNNAALREKWHHSADRLIELAHDLNYDFNTQGYDFGIGKTFTVREAYRQPDAVAGYAYLMTLSAVFFDETRYLEEAQTALSIYQSFDQNPWYEVPSGAMACLAAAYLNSVGNTFDLQKILEFVFDSESGSLLSGRWGSRAINGLMIGWRGFSREFATDSAYSMETMIVLPYILPVVRYDPRYARAIGKYALHASVNTRLFFSDYLPETFQSRPDLRPEIPYEKLCREVEGVSPYGTGDCEGHKSVYGGGFTLWWGSIIEATNDAYIPRFDVTKTDFLAQRAYPSFLYYNPFGHERRVTLDVGHGSYDVYDLTLHDFILSNVGGKVDLALPPDDAKVFVVVPHYGERKNESGKLYMNGIVVDFHCE